MHKLVKGTPLVLAGVKIPYSMGLKGDSDADVVCHALIDALLGSIGQGDIGTFFGMGKPELMNAVSLKLLEQTRTHINKEGFMVSNADCSIIAQSPHLNEFRKDMINNLNVVLGTDHVSVKYTTPKHIGPLGNSEAIACVAIASVIENTNK